MSIPTITRQSVLRRAAEILQANGRNTETYYDVVQHEDDDVPVDRCRMCVMGALIHAAGVDLDGPAPFATAAGLLARDAGLALIEHLGLLPFPPSFVVAFLGAWNDAPERTDEQVIAALIDTADHLDQAEEASR